jgi:hypothetical protein
LAATLRVRLVRVQHHGVAVLQRKRLELAHGLIAVPEVEGLPVIRRWHAVHSAGKVL